MKKVTLILSVISAFSHPVNAQWDSCGQFSKTAILTSMQIGYDLIITPPNIWTNTLVKSTDEWKTWTPIFTASSYISKINFLNDTVGYMVYYTDEGLGGLEQTINGGISWEPIMGGPPGMHFSFPRPNFGYVEVWPLLKLYDYGNWSVQCTLSNITAWIDFEFINDSVGFMTHYSFPNTNTSRSSNYGITWNWLNAALDTIETILFPDDSIGYCFNTKNQFFTSYDQGLNWTIVDTLPFVGINTIFFLKRYTGWIAGNGGKIFKTVNGGIEWDAVSSFNTDDIVKMQFYNDSSGYYLAVHEWTPGNIKYYLYKTSIGPLGIEEQKLSNAIKISPNPVNSFLTLSLNNSQNKIELLEIYSIKGERMFHYASFIERIDVSGYKNGIYLLYYRIKGRNYPIRFIVLK